MAVGSGAAALRDADFTLGCGVRNVLVGTILVGTLLSSMVFLNFSYSAQNLLKSLVLLLALLVAMAIN